jgi:diguanylate cyclase (GGDEF)-like protein
MKQNPDSVADSRRQTLYSALHTPRATWGFYWEKRVRFLSGGMKILAIDDDPFTLDALVDILHEMAFVETAVGGRLGVEAAFESQPDLILCDVTMPDLDSIEVCRRLSFDPRTSHIPIVCISGGVREAEEIQALSAGAVDYIKKPLNPQLVRARVKIHLDCVVKTAQAWEMARRDSLTGIFNRRYFDERLEREWDRHRRSEQWLAVALVDLDHFKPFNDRYGHVKGDECLITVADALSGCARRSDELAARYGGEEFVFLLPATPPEGADEFGRLACDEVRALHLAHGASSKGVVTASVGVASLRPAPGLEPMDLLRLADKALYQAKNAGRDCHRIAEPGV